jgi:hypothetical protein
MIKQIVILFSVVLILSSCEKNEPQPLYTYELETVDSTAWQDQYADGGTVTAVGNQTNVIAGTKWVLTKYVTAFATEYPNDTIDFIDNNHYVLNSNAERTYQLSSIPSSTNYDLQLNYFMPFGGSQYSADVGYYFVEDGEMNNTQFRDIQNTSKTIRAWFEKI